MATRTNAAQAAADEVLAVLARMRKTREWLAEQSGISLSTLTRRLNGGSSFTLDELVQIARTLDISISELLKPVAALAGGAAA